MQGPLASAVTPYERGRRFLKPGEALRAGESLTSVDCKSKLVSECPPVLRGARVGEGGPRGMRPLKSAQG